MTSMPSTFTLLNEAHSHRMHPSQLFVSLLLLRFAMLLMLLLSVVTKAWLTLLLLTSFISINTACADSAIIKTHIIKSIPNIRPGIHRRSLMNTTCTTSITDKK
mmetsp:Transcript_21683/g.34009  ORF Transcript_21683/g.34009 Transcript_21683/m.34009 type:complete len:104 (+) Transcript_21683:730-1041(+)